MKRLVVLLVAFLIAVCGTQAGTFKGSAKFKNGVMDWCMEFVLIYDEEKGEGVLSWRKSPGEGPPGGPWVEAKFIATRKASVKGGNSLIGFAIDKGYPVTLVVDVWKKKKTFKFYDAFMFDELVVKGFIK